MKISNNNHFSLDPYLLSSHLHKEEKAEAKSEDRVVAKLEEKSQGKSDNSLQATRDKYSQNNSVDDNSAKANTAAGNAIAAYNEVKKMV